MRLIVAIVVASLALATASSSAPGPTATDHAAKAMQKGDFKTALAELKPLAEKGDPNAQFFLAMLYDAGNGVARDQARAASLYRKAAEQHHLMAQVFLGVLYYSGQGVKKDLSEAAHWFQAPADSGNDQAQFYLGSLYESGEGVKQDDSTAIHYLSGSAAQRNTRAMGMLATALFSRSQGHGDQDLVDAYTWSHLAAEMDPVQAMTSSSALIEQYCNDDQKKRGEEAMANWKRLWSSASKR